MNISRGIKPSAILATVYLQAALWAAFFVSVSLVFYILFLVLPVAGFAYRWHLPYPTPFEFCRDQPGQYRFQPLEYDSLGTLLG